MENGRKGNIANLSNVVGNKMIMYIVEIFTSINLKTKQMEKCLENLPKLKIKKKEK